MPPTSARVPGPSPNHPHPLGKGGGRERVAWACAKIEARFGAIRIDQLCASRLGSNLDQVGGVVVVAGQGEQLAEDAADLPACARRVQAGDPDFDLARSSVKVRRIVTVRAAASTSGGLSGIELGEWGDAARFVAATGMR